MLFISVVKHIRSNRVGEYTRGDRKFGPESLANFVGNNFP